MRSDSHRVEVRICIDIDENVGECVTGGCGTRESAKNTLRSKLSLQASARGDGHDQTSQL